MGNQSMVKVCGTMFIREHLLGAYIKHGSQKPYQVYLRISGSENDVPIGETGSWDECDKLIETVWDCYMNSKGKALYNHDAQMHGEP